MKTFSVGVIYFSREKSLGMLWSDTGNFEERGGHWKCSACLMTLSRDETPQEHAAKNHPLVPADSATL